VEEVVLAVQQEEDLHILLLAAVEQAVPKVPELWGVVLVEDLHILLAVESMEVWEVVIRAEEVRRDLAVVLMMKMKMIRMISLMIGQITAMPLIFKISLSL
jgi:hypothetical protein